MFYLYTLHNAPAIPQPWMLGVIPSENSLHTHIKYMPLYTHFILKEHEKINNMAKAVPYFSHFRHMYSLSRSKHMYGTDNFMCL